MLSPFSANEPPTTPALPSGFELTSTLTAGRTFLVRDVSSQEAHVLRHCAGDARRLEQRFANLSRSVAPTGAVFERRLTRVDRHLLSLRPWVPGAPLSAIREGWELERALKTFAAVARVADALHAAGLVHGRLHGHNLIVGEDGLVSIVDALDLSPALPARNAGATEVSLSRQRLEGRLPTRADDLFGLGVILFELVTGRHPFTAATRAEALRRALYDPPGFTVSEERRLPHALRATVMALLDKRPSARPATAGEILRAIGVDVPTAQPRTLAGDVQRASDGDTQTREDRVSARSVDTAPVVTTSASMNVIERARAAESGASVTASPDVTATRTIAVAPIARSEPTTDAALAPLAAPATFTASSNDATSPAKRSGAPIDLPCASDAATPPLRVTDDAHLAAAVQLAAAAARLTQVTVSGDAAATLTESLRRALAAGADGGTPELTSIAKLVPPLRRGATRWGVRAAVVGAAVLGMTAIAGLSADPLEQEIADLLAQRQVVQARARIDSEARARTRDDVVVAKLRGDVQCAAGEYDSCLRSYLTALGQSSRYADDDTLRANTLALFEREDRRWLAASVAAQLDGVEDALLDGTRSDHYWRRWSSVRALEARGERDLINFAEVYALDVLTSGTCATRRTALAKVLQLRDAAALPSLEEAKRQTEKKLFGDLCLGGELDAAIASLKQD